MSKYNPLWNYIAEHCVTKTVLTFEEIEKTVGVPIDHSFLTYKKELTEYGFEVEKVFLKEKKVVFKKLTESKNAKYDSIKSKSDKLVLYIHGKGGSADEAEHYRSLFPNCDILGFDYKAVTPWEAKKEFPNALNGIFEKYSRILLIANSIGAYFAMCALPREKLERAYFISPIVDMEKLICDMLTWESLSEAELCEKGIIDTSFGETLSWEYLCYTRAHGSMRNMQNIRNIWNVPTEIFYGELCRTVGLFVFLYFFLLPCFLPHFFSEFLLVVFGLFPSSESAFASSSVSGTVTAYPVLSFAEAMELVKKPSFGSSFSTRFFFDMFVFLSFCVLMFLMLSDERSFCFSIVLFLLNPSYNNILYSVFSFMQKANTIFA